MNILYIIGNGFDLNLGLKTSYSEFYKYYKSVKSPSSLIEELKEKIDNNYENWADLEIALGVYTGNLNSSEEFDQIYEDIAGELGTYLENEEKSLEITSSKKEKFIKYLISPETYLLPADLQKLNKFKSNFANAHWGISIITFNYTTTIEKILGNSSANQEISNHNGGFRIIFKGIHHIHGYFNKRIVLGVNDIEQIKNINFHSNQELLEAIVKAKHNDAAKETINTTCRSLISGADLICIFGSSIGLTDKCWWELIGEKLKGQTWLIIFIKRSEIDYKFSHKIARYEREIKDKFFQMTNLSEKERNEVQDKIFIGFNTAIFSDII